MSKTNEKRTNRIFGCVSNFNYFMHCSFLSKVVRKVGEEANKCFDSSGRKVAFKNLTLCWL